MTATPVAHPDHARITARLDNARILIVHEWLYTWAGAERVLEEMLAVFPQADLLVGVMTPRMRDFNAVTRRARESWLGAIPGARTRHRWFLPLHALAFATWDTSAYDVVISASHAFEKFLRPSRTGVHVCYCHSPPRFVWDLQATYEARLPATARLALRTAAPFLRVADRYAAAGVDHFIANSRNVAERIRRLYGRESDVVYPPVSARDARGSANSGESSVVPREPYLLTLGRLVPYKRVDLAVQAAEQLGMKLVVVGDGPERPALERLSGRHVEFRGEVTDAEAAALMRACSAFVFAGLEDFGIAMVEANACGRPVVCFAAGGALESMVPGVTAEFFAEASVAALANAVERCVARRWDAAVLQRNAERFSPEHFRAGLRRSVARAMVLSGRS